jgi:NAD(P)H-flavin reductase
MLFTMKIVTAWYTDNDFSPLISMLSDISKSSTVTGKPKITFLYTTKVSSSSPYESESILFLSRLEQIRASSDGNMDLQVFITGRQSGNEEIRLPKTLNRRIEERNLLAAVGRENGATVCFVCGPPVMTDDFVEYFGKVVGQDKVFCEKWW